MILNRGRLQAAGSRIINSIFSYNINYFYFQAAIGKRELKHRHFRVYPLRFLELWLRGGGWRGDRVQGVKWMRQELLGVACHPAFWGSFPVQYPASGSCRELLQTFSFWLQGLWDLAAQLLLGPFWVPQETLDSPHSWVGVAQGKCAMSQCLRATPLSCLCSSAAMSCSTRGTLGCLPAPCSKAVSSLLSDFPVCLGFLPYPSLTHGWGGPFLRDPIEVNLLPFPGPWNLQLVWERAYMGSTEHTFFQHDGLWHKWCDFKSQLLITQKH